MANGLTIWHRDLSGSRWRSNNANQKRWHRHVLRQGVRAQHCENLSAQHAEAFLLFPKNCSAHI